VISLDQPAAAFNLKAVSAVDTAEIVHVLVGEFVHQQERPTDAYVLKAVVAVLVIVLMINHRILALLQMHGADQKLVLNITCAIFHAAHVV
jgi:hypothetical protein